MGPARRSSRLAMAVKRWRCQGGRGVPCATWAADAEAAALRSRAGPSDLDAEASRLAGITAVFRATAGRAAHHPLGTRGRW